jgi:AraC-like DNA-binding protein
MSAVFTNDGVPVASRAEYWRHVLGEAIVPLEPLGLPDRVVAGNVGSIAVGELSHRGDGGAKRTTAHIRRCDAELCKVDVIARGRGVIEQGGREARLGPGDLTLVDLSRPAGWAMSSIRCVAVIFPKSLLPLRPRDAARLTAVRIPGDEGAGALISSLARQLPARLGDWNGVGGARLAGAIVDLLTVALAAGLDRTAEVPTETRRRALLERIRAFIDERLGDPQLSPSSIAAAHFISLRKLHKLFQTQETTVAEWIRRRRLERCARDLLDPALAAEPVGAIGARWGYTNPAHFSRAFRAAHGLPPSEYRLTASGAYPDAVATGGTSRSVVAGSLSPVAVSRQTTVTSAAMVPARARRARQRS